MTGSEFDSGAVDASAIDTLPATSLDDEDRDLLRRLRAGEDAAFGELFSRHCDAVRRLAFGLAADRAEAEDLTAEAFFRVLQAIKRGSGPTDNVRGYLLIVARRVAWEWNGRRRDVPVSDEELNHRVGADPDRSGQSTERTLITRAFTSLPERWRSVLWEVEVEGARPAVVAGNFGLSPNATAALARRARQGLRAAYLQAHLAIDRGSTGCRSVLEKLGGYTAGTIKGVERRKVRAHLATCASCTAMVDELQDVCSGLRAHAAFLAAPIAGVALWQHMGAASTAAGWTVKGLLANAKVQVALAASSAAAVGVFGFAMVAMGPAGTTAAYDDFDGRAPADAIITDAGSASPAPNGVPSVTKTPDVRQTGKPPLPGHQTAATSKSGVAIAKAEEVVRLDAPVGSTTSTSAAPRMLLPGDEYDTSAPVVYQESSTERSWAIYSDREVVKETTTETSVNAANQTTVATKTTEYTVYKTAEPDSSYARVFLSPTGEPEPTGLEPTESKPTESQPTDVKPVETAEPPASDETAKPEPTVEPAPEPTTATSTTKPTAS